MNFKDAVIRTVYHKYHHPKEVLVSNGVLNRSISLAAGKSIPGQNLADSNNAQYVSFFHNYLYSFSMCNYLW